MLFCTCSNTLYFHRFKISKSKKSVRHKRFAPRSGPEAIKKYKSRKKNKKNPTSPPKNVETSGKCQSITAKKNEDQFSFLPQVISPASGQWREISPKVPAIHHTQTHTHTSRALEQECRKIVFTKWNLTISMVFPSSEAERKPKAGLNIHRVVFQLYISIVKHYRRQNRASRALQTS